MARKSKKAVDAEVIELTEVYTAPRTIRQRLRRGTLLTLATIAAVDVCALAYVKVRAEVAEMAVGMAHATVVGAAEEFGYAVLRTENSAPVNAFDRNEFIGER